MRNVLFQSAENHQNDAMIGCDEEQGQCNDGMNHIDASEAAVDESETSDNGILSIAGPSANQPIRDPRLTSGAFIDAKNTLQSNSLVVAATEQSQLENTEPHRNQDFYKHIHGASSPGADPASPNAEQTRETTTGLATNHRAIAPIAQLNEPPPTSMVLFARALCR
jgi:hypothetical protein